MEAFEALNSELSALLSQHFQVIATHSQRQDQWYKRSYQSFTSKHGDRKPLILVPRESREEWVPHVRHFAAMLANQLRATSPSDKTGESSTMESKVFSDRTLDKAYTTPLCLSVSGPKPLSPDMMQMSWWTVKRQHPDDKSRRIWGIKALIACGEVDPLLRLASWPQKRKQQESDINSSQWISLNNGWQNILDSTLVIMLFLATLKAFPEDLVAEDGYNLWVPVAFFTDNSPLRPYIEARGGRISITAENIQQEMTQCLKALVAAQAWSLKGGYQAINWEDRIVHNFLYILGFEAWNRNREGEGYLGCDLNITKTAKSLRLIGQEDDEEEGQGDVRSQQGQKKPMDPLKLREPKQELIPELDDEEQQKLEELAVIESYEKDYGRKRSTKYMAKHKSDNQYL